ncbi:MAG TPA: aminotransferase class III-fold pyridoxal phosphate-dependent enzyme [Rhizomicrobium sp.]|nr:aminotransferase class III-fold pyridoxal phosphate-dependent enzyme [Rhizomicrobium sp.]
MRKLPFGHLFAGKSHEPAIALAEKLKEIAPFQVGKVFFANSGSEANDTQIKLFWYANNARGESGRKTIISREKAYHGVTIAAASLTKLPANHRSFDLPLDFVRFAESPHHYRNALPEESEEDFSARLADSLDGLIQREGPETVAAMIVEPIQGAGGVLLPPKGYFARIEEVLARYGIPLIDDEVITGFGRTGNWFACTTYDFRPASMTLAKALSSAYLPISAVLISPELGQLIEEESGRVGTFGHGYTYTGHPVAAAVALKTIEIYQERDILGRVRSVSPRFLGRLARLHDHPLVGEAAGIGLSERSKLLPTRPAGQISHPRRQLRQRSAGSSRKRESSHGRCWATESVFVRRSSSARPRSTRCSIVLNGDSTADLIGPGAKPGRRRRARNQRPARFFARRGAKTASFALFFASSCC